MTTYITIIISAISVSFAIFFGLKSNKRADNEDIANTASNNAIINMKLDTIGDNVKEIKTDVAETKKQYIDMDKRLVKVEEATKSAHKRLDNVIGNERSIMG